jgi:hypothetical protein
MFVPLSVLDFRDRAATIKPTERACFGVRAKHG